MAYSRKDELRALNDDEAALVEQSHNPVLQELSDKELAALLKLVRERRDKAQTEARRRRREMRGKAAPKGTEPSRKDAGSRLKADVLAAAVRRLNTESERRRVKAARDEMMENARKALAMRGSQTGSKRPQSARSAGKGMKARPNQKTQKLARPMEVGRVSQAVKTAQAKRDGR